MAQIQKANRQVSTGFFSLIGKGKQDAAMKQKEPEVRNEPIQLRKQPSTIQVQSSNREDSEELDDEIPDTPSLQQLQHQCVAKNPQFSSSKD